MCPTAQAPRNLRLDVAFAPWSSLENPAPTSLKESPNPSFLGVGSLVHKLVNFCLLPELSCGDCSGLPSWEIARTQGAGNTLTSAQQPELGLGGQLEIPVHPTSCRVSLFAILLCSLHLSHLLRHSSCHYSDLPWVSQSGTVQQGRIP